MESFNIEEPTDDFENKAFEVLRTSKASLLLNNNFPDLTKIFAVKTYKINSGRQFFKIMFFSYYIMCSFNFKETIIVTMNIKYFQLNFSTNSFD